jgi:hypothetical protein
MEPAREARMMSGTKRPRAPRKPTQESGGGTPPPSRRKAAEFNVPIKLWVSQEMYDEIEKVATEREWSVPQVIRRMCKIVLGERKLG